MFQVGASIMHVPSGLFVYGLYQSEQNDGTQWKTCTSTTITLFDQQGQLQRANENDVLVREGRYQEGLDAGGRHGALRRVGPV